MFFLIQESFSSMVKRIGGLVFLLFLAIFVQKNVFLIGILIAPEFVVDVNVEDFFNQGLLGVQGSLDCPLTIHALVFEHANAFFDHAVDETAVKQFAPFQKTLVLFHES